jgi:dihydroorotase
LSDILIKGGRVIDPASGRDGVFDVLIRRSVITQISKTVRSRGIKTIHAKGMVVCPGFIDLHCHLRDPGRPDKETIETGSQAAVAGGFSTVCCMPNTDPPIDNEGIVQYINREAALVDLCRVFPIAAITKHRGGKELTEFGVLVKAGAKGFSDDGDEVTDGNVLRRALEYSRAFDVPIFEHPIDRNLAQNGIMHEGLVATRLGLRGSPAIAEESCVMRDILLARFTGARMHLCHISTKGAVELIRRAKQDKIGVTCETCPHYFFYNDEMLESFDTNCKVNPPLRSEADRQAVIQGLRDGTIDCIATDHAPHCLAEKELEITQAPFGLIGFETALSMITMELISKQKFSWIDVLRTLTTNPARILGVITGTLQKGAPADVTIFDPNKQWKVTPQVLRSRSKNTPLLDKAVTGRVNYVIVNGVVKYKLSE